MVLRNGRPRVTLLEDIPVFRRSASWIRIASRAERVIFTGAARKLSVPSQGIRKCAPEA
jgi:hypothetical protein